MVMFLRMIVQPIVISPDPYRRIADLGLAACKAGLVVACSPMHPLKLICVVPDRCDKEPPGIGANGSDICPKVFMCCSYAQRSAGSKKAVAAVVAKYHLVGLGLDLHPGSGRSSVGQLSGCRSRNARMAFVPSSLSA